MIVIINGAFGVGKTSVAKRLVKNIPNSMMYNPEEIGFMLRNIIPDEIINYEEKSESFQDLDLWKKLVINIAKELINKYKKNLIIPITLRNHKYFNHIYHGLSLIDSEVYHFCLTASIETIHKRLLKRGDKPGTRCFNETLNCVEAFKHIEFKEHIDTENLNLDNVEDIILEKIKKLRNSLIRSEYLSKREYSIKAKNVDLKLLNSSHQSVTHIYKKKPYYEINLQTHPLIIQQELDIYDLSKYIVNLRIKDIDSEKLNRLVNSLSFFEKEKYKMIEKVLNYTRTMNFSKKVAEEMFNSKDNKNDIKSVLKDEDNCIQSTNIFIAIVRRLNIPAKFILGKISNDSYHTWAEIFIEKVGWIPVETQICIPIDVNKGYFGITNKHIKICEGVNFEDISKKHFKFDFEIKGIK